MDITEYTEATKEIIEQGEQTVELLEKIIQDEEDINPMFRLELEKIQRVVKEQTDLIRVYDYFAKTVIKAVD